MSNLSKLVAQAREKAAGASQAPAAPAAQAQNSEPANTIASTQTEESKQPEQPTQTELPLDLGSKNPKFTGRLAKLDEKLNDPTPNDPCWYFHCSHASLAFLPDGSGRKHHFKNHFYVTKDPKIGAYILKQLCNRPRAVVQVKAVSAQFMAAANMIQPKIEPLPDQGNEGILRKPKA